MNDLVNVGDPSDFLPLPFDPATIDDLEWRLAGNGRPGPTGSLRPPWGHDRAARVDAVEMVLYVSGSSVSCSRAARAVHDVVREFPANSLKLRVVDVLDDIDGATRDRVLFTPTLIFTDRQQRKTRVLGDLSNTRVLWDLLVGAGLEPI